MKKILFLFVAAFVCALGANAEVWKKVTSAPADWSGKYLIACDNNEDWAVLDGSRSGDPTTGNLQSSMNYKVYDVNADGDIVLDACDYYVTIAPKGNGYTLCTASGWYIGNNADSNALGTTTNADAFINTISLDAEQGVLITATEGGSVLRYNHANGQDRFRFYKSSTYTNQQKIALYKLDEAPVAPEVNGYVAASKAGDIKAGQEIVILNKYGWGAGTWRTSDYMWYHNTDMDEAEVAGNPIFVYDGDVNVDGCPTSFLVEAASNGNFYLKDLATGKYLNGASTLSQSDEPTTAWSLICTDPEQRFFEVSYSYNGSKRYLGYGGWVNGGPLIAADRSQEQPKRIFIKGGAGNGGEEPEGPEVGGNWDGTVIPSITSFSSLDELEGMTLTFPGAKKVELDEEYGYFTFQNEQGSDLYAVWAPGYGGEYEVNGNVVTIHNLFVHPQICTPLSSEITKVYMEDYGMFIVDGVADYFNTVELDYIDATPVVTPFDLVIRNNGVICQNGKTVEANEAGIGTDFYLETTGLTAKGTTATLYKDGEPMTFALTFVDPTAISFFGGSSLITEPGTYTLIVPAGTYVDAEGNPSNQFYGQWVIVEKDVPAYVEPVLKAEDVSDQVAYYIYTTARGGLTVESTDATRLVGTSEAGVYQSVDPTDVRQQFAFVNIEGKLYLYSVATEKFIGKANRGNFTDEPVDPIYFKNAANGTVMLYFDDSFNINLGGSKQVTIDTWKTKDAGNSFIIKVAEPFDQTPIFEKLFPTITEWTGDIVYSNASSIDDLLDLTVEFTGGVVEASGFDILGAIFDETGDPYAIVEGNGVFDAFGQVAIEGDKACFKFQKIADLSAAHQNQLKAGLAKIGGFESTPGEASVVFAGKSFIIDGVLYRDMICKNFVFGESGKTTGINGVANDAKAQIFDLQGRRVRAAQNGMYIINGQKVVK